ncbi:MAG: hydroxymyristoyl-ACP dehydratase [Bacteroidales bacterium]|nr:hydroxymyristoyl-ACP dehydratase [Bacteroidales bacterium]
MLQGKEIEKILPQSFPMVMIDTLFSSDEEKTVTGLSVKEDNIFISEGKFREPGIIENMAQTAAVRSGYEALKNNTKVRTGYIGSIKNLSIYSLPKVNDTLQTILTPQSDIGDISVVKTEVFSNKEKIAECTMTIILAD